VNGIEVEVLAAAVVTETEVLDGGGGVKVVSPLTADTAEAEESLVVVDG